MPPRSLCELSASAVAIPAAAAGSVGFNVTATRNHVGLDLACKPLGSRPDIAALLAANPIQFGTSVDPSSASKRNRVFCGSSLMQHAQPLSAIPSRSDPSVSHHPVPVISWFLFFQPAGPAGAKVRLAAYLQ